MDAGSGAEVRPMEGSEREAEESRASSEERAKQIYLRTVYPLNPGIPHFVDVPGGW